MRILKRTVWTFVALVFLLEAWLWETLGPIFGRLVAMLPMERLKETLRAAISRLSPWATLPIFLLPGLVLTPFKLAAMWLIAQGHPFLGIVAFLVAKSVGVGLAAFLFAACKPNLMRMAWFVRVYETVIRVRDWAHRQADPYLRKARESAAAARTWLARRLPKGTLGRRLRLLRRRFQRV